MKNMVCIIAVLVVTLPLTAQRVGIGTGAPLALLHVNSEDALFLGSTGNINPQVGLPQLPNNDGTILHWYAGKGAFRFGFKEGSKWSRENTGFYSFSGGYSNEAVGYASIALGNSNKALGYNAIAIGTSNFAPSDGAIAMGSRATASGIDAIAIGSDVTASSQNSFVIGRFNRISGTQQAWVTTDPLFIIGNGTNLARNNAVTVLKNGNTGIGTHNPKALLQLNNGDFVATGTWSANPPNPEVSEGSRLHWYAAKSAILSGFPSPESSMANSVGNYSSSFGFENIASGESSFAAGKLNESTSTASFALGQSNLSARAMSIAIGNTNIATARETAVLGTGLRGSTFRTVVVGSYNYDSYADGNENGWRNQDAIFVIGNGQADNTRSNAMVVLKSGLVGIGRAPDLNRLEVNGNASKSSAGSWSANSDGRLKKNIVPLQGALNKILQLNGVSFEWNDAKTGYERPKGVQMGFIAQNIQQVFPEMVVTDKAGYLKTAYGTYDALLVEAIRELQDQITALKQTIENLKQNR